MVDRGTQNACVAHYDVGIAQHILFPSGPEHLDAGFLARFLSGLRFEVLPPEVVHKAKQILLDTIGCIAAGTDTPLGKRLLDAYKAEASNTGCVVPGSGMAAGPSIATKLNAWLSDVLDYEDVAVGHPSATVIPAAMAMAEHVRATPRQFLTGVVGGYEAGIRLHDSTQASPEVYKRFAVYHAWHGFAAGAAAMGVSGGTEEQFRSALGHAAANTSIPIWYVQYGRPAHALKANYGQMALGGIDAALCARQNIIGPFAMISDPERGFARIVGSDNFDPSRLSHGLGDVWRIKESSLKAFPACAFLHTTADAINNLIGRNSIDHRNVEKVWIRCFSRIPHWFSDMAPASDIDAQLSIQYVSAMALLSVKPGRAWYAPSQLGDATVSALMKRIHIEVDPVAEQGFWRERMYRSTVTVATKNGQYFTMTVDWAPGHWRRPFSDEDVLKKFINNIKGTSIEKNGSQIADIIVGMERSDSLENLWKSLRNR
ncbi:MmgE/PrpD family protein [Chelatococcus asaccharovorans]|uniref:2-methylcitrate dehydratase PrpD n=1 Tax=Chelatococcus asaccharovorans TaxID=28210 RepID=A0A2V3U526_9HYPH|nr:MmgE/PrpD family protein [Chelatococcus asaccharovorans]MBS7703755.1 MmgE/PrpD family protein [Chelatococcus asaccharovorans]PXW57915.1 2-methylcitrate dehydratase PrpD [Chelatococcus asaccharovorans]